MPIRSWRAQGYWIRRCLVALALPIMAGTPAYAETLLVYGDDSYPPILYSGADGQPTGVLADILRKVSERTGDTYELQLFPWKRAYERARTGHAAIVGISRNSERLAQFDFSDPLYFDDIQIVVKKGQEFPFGQLSDLKGKTVGGVLGASYGEVVDAAIRDGLFKVDQDVGQRGRLHKVLLGRVNAALIGNGTEGFDMVLRSDPELQARRGDFLILGTPLTRDLLHLAAAKSMNKKALIERFNQALRDLQKPVTAKTLAKETTAKK